MSTIRFFSADRFATVLNDFGSCRNSSGCEYAIAMHCGVANDVPGLFNCCHEFESFGSGAFHTKTMLRFRELTSTHLISVALYGLAHDALHIRIPLYKFGYTLTTQT